MNDATAVRRATTTALLLALLTSAPALAARPASSAVTQWVWSRADARALADARATRPDVAAAVFLAELRFDGAARVALRLPPDVAGAPSFLVIRLDDSWRRAPLTASAELDAAIARVLAAAGPRFADVPVQIDYDAPVAQLQQYAAWLRDLRARSLRGRTVWITTLIAHLRSPQLRDGPGIDALAHVVDGHVVQVFDTGERPTAAAMAELAALLATSRVPYGLGVAAFERGDTDHAEWLAVLPTLTTSPRFRGTWIFPAGFGWRAMLAVLP